MLTDEQTHALQKQAKATRETIINSLVAAGSGHTAGPLGMADIFTAFYFHILKHDPKNPTWEERDRLILSNGHICPVLYAALAHSGYFPVEECLTLRKFGSRLQGHPERLRLPGLETTSGPLGSGLSQASGQAYAARMDDKKHRVYCLMSDGEQEEGNTWEAAMFAGKNKLHNLTAVMDRNNIQIDGNTENVMPLEPLADKYRAFNWHVLEVNGHDIPAFVEAVEEAKTIYEKPTLIIAHTISGKGVPEIEGDYHWHGKPPTREEGERFLEQIRRGFTPLEARSEGAASTKRALPLTGFTLIELLVVIAIIGILSAVVLSSLSTARSRGNDAAVKQDLHGVQVQAELYSITNNGYGDATYGIACNTGMFSEGVIARAKANADDANGSGKVYCYSASNEYLMIAELASGYWCIDSTGATREKTGAAPTSAPAGYVCP